MSRIEKISAAAAKGQFRLMENYWHDDEDGANFALSGGIPVVVASPLLHRAPENREKNKTPVVYRPVVVVVVAFAVRRTVSHATTPKPRVLERRVSPVERFDARLHTRSWKGLVEIPFETSVLSKIYKRFLHFAHKYLQNSHAAQRTVNIRYQFF